MKPPMRQQVTARVPILDSEGNPSEDDYGRPETVEISSNARVQMKTQLILDAQGQQRDASIEIDLPAHFNPASGDKISYKTIAGYEGTGTIIAKEEVTNIAGSKLYYRTVYVHE